MQTVGGRYVVDGRLGEGGMGHVYRVRHLQLGKPFALKVISPAFAEDSAARARFNQEAKLASEISHPNIVSVVDYGEDAALGAYMVMELVEGEPLVGPPGTPPSIRRALDVLAQVSDALDFIHRRGIVHGDVKADNIMLAAEPGGANGARRRRMVRLLDFGLAHRHDAAQETVSGSPHYLAPERCAGGPATVATDIYALGVLGYLLFTGSLPFDGSVMDVLLAHVQRAPEPPSLRRREPLDGSIEALITRAMAKDPTRRHPSAAAFRYELNNVMEMLDMSPRRARGSGAVRAESAREASLVQAFERSHLPQALVSIEGVVAFANSAFGQLVGRLDGLALADSALATHVPGLTRVLRAVHADGRPAERRAKIYRGERQAPLELTLWFAPLPFPGQEIHLIVRVDDPESRRSG